MGQNVHSLAHPDFQKCLWSPRQRAVFDVGPELPVNCGCVEAHHTLNEYFTPVLQPQQRYALYCARQS